MSALVLVVEDERAIALALSGLLKKEGYEVKTAASHAEALTAIAGQRNAFEHLASNGGVDDRTAVVTRLKNLLVDGFAVGLLSDGAAPWVE